MRKWLVHYSIIIKVACNEDKKSDGCDSGQALDSLSLNKIAILLNCYSKYFMTFLAGFQVSDRYPLGYLFLLLFSVWKRSFLQALIFSDVVSHQDKPVRITIKISLGSKHYLA